MTVGVRFTKESAKRIATVVRATEASPVNLAPFRRRSHQTTEAVGGDYSDWAFGFSISGAVVTVNAGEVQHGKRAIMDIAQKGVTITADHQYIWVEHILETGGASIALPSTERPVTDDIMYRIWLYQFRLVAGVASLEKIGHLGNIAISSAYG